MISVNKGRTTYLTAKSPVVIGINTSRTSADIQLIADLINFRIKYVESGVSKNDLFTLLRKIKKDYSFDSINLSLGICEDLEALFTLCTALTDKGAIIISVLNNPDYIMVEGYSFACAHGRVLVQIFCERITHFHDI